MIAPTEGTFTMAVWTIGAFSQDTGLEETPSTLYTNQGGYDTDHPFN